MSSPNSSDAFTFLPQGGIIQAFRVGNQNLVLGFPSAESYRSKNDPYFGENIGRYANRISGAKINNLNGKSYELAVNNGPNTLHGGLQGWGKKVFDGPTPVSRSGRDALLFTYLSKDDEEGFPGTVQLKMWYTASTEKDGDKDKTSLEIEYEAVLVGDEVEETAVSLTNHSYFNISGNATIEGTRAKVASNLHLVTDEHSIPTGEIKPFPGIPHDEEFVFGAEEPDPDHCFVVNADPSSIPLDSRQDQLKKLVELYHPNTKIHLEALSTEPAFQFYAGRFIDVPATDGLPARGARSGLCIECSRYVNAINHEPWRQQVILKKGQTWGSRTVYRAWCD